MNAEYKREDHKSYFVVKDQRLDREDELYGIRMLCDNPMKGLLPVCIHTFNGERELYYDISSKQTMRLLYEKKELDRDDLNILLTGLQEAIDSVEEYLLDMECLIIDPEYIYINGADHTIFLLYYPFREEDFEQTVYAFADYILERVCHDDEQAVIYAYGFYRYVKEEQGDLKEALKRSLTDRERDEREQKQEMEGEAEKEVEGVGFYLDEENELPDSIKETPEVKKADSTMAVAFFGVLSLGGIGILLYSVWQYHLSWQNLFSVKETVIGAGIFAIAAAGAGLFGIGGHLQGRKRCTKHQPQYSDQHQDQEDPAIEKSDRIPDDTKDDLTFSIEERMPEERKEESCCETVLLQENCYREQRILVGRIRGRKKQIDLSSFPFMIGKSREQADYILEDPSVSRLHARFTLRDDIVYLTDLNSTNGTTKNGIRLEPNELVMLEADDEISFGRVSFTYH